MAKIRFTDKKLLNQFFVAIGFVGSIASIVALVITLPGWWKLLSIAIIVVLIVTLVIIYCAAANKKSASLKINGIEVNIKEGDIFEINQDSINVIPFNEYYDVIVDDAIIAEHSLHGIYINKYWCKRENELNDLIHNDKRLSKYKAEYVKTRTIGNKQKYEIGSLVCVDKYVLTALSHFDDKNRAYLSYQDYIAFLISFWKNIDEVYANRTINIPIFGSGITRINDKKPTIQTLLETILWSIKDSDFQGKKINIIVYKDDVSKIDFYHIEPTIY